MLPPLPPPAATMLLRVQVTPADVAAGKRCHSSGCPVGLAAARAALAAGLEGGIAIVSAFCLAYGSLSRRRYVDLPAKASEWIQRFDKGLAVRPIGFEVTLDVSAAEE